MNALLTMVFVTMLRAQPDPTDPYLPDSNKPPKGFGGLGNAISVITGGLIFLFMGIAVAMIIWRVGRAAMSDRHQIRDAQTPVVAFLILAFVGSILQVIFGIFSAVIRAA